MKKLCFVLGMLACVSGAAGAQARLLKIVSSDSAPIVYAFVTVEGGDGKITDEHGEISLGAGQKKTIACERAAASATSRSSGKSICPTLPHDDRHHAGAFDANTRCRAGDRASGPFASPPAVL